MLLEVLCFGRICSALYAPAFHFNCWWILVRYRPNPPRPRPLHATEQTKLLSGARTHQISPVASHYPGVNSNFRKDGGGLPAYIPNRLSLLFSLPHTGRATAWHFPELASITCRSHTHLICSAPHRLRL